MGKTAFIKTVLGWDDQQFKAGAAAATNAIKRLQVDSAQAATGIKKTGDASSRAGMGMMALGQAIDDVQYGFRGVVNNIPQVVTMLGGSAGLAGAAIIAGVAFNQLQQWLDAEEKKSRGDTFTAQKEAIDAVTRSVGTYSEYLKQLTKDQEAVADAIKTVIDAQMQLAKTSIEASDMPQEDKIKAEAARAKSAVDLAAAQKLAPATKSVEDARSLVTISEREKDRADAELASVDKRLAAAEKRAKRLNQIWEAKDIVPTSLRRAAGMVPEPVKQAEAEVEAARKERAKTLALQMKFSEESAKQEQQLSEAQKELDLLRSTTKITAETQKNEIDVRAASELRKLNPEDPFEVRQRWEIPMQRPSRPQDAQQFTADQFPKQIFYLLKGLLEPAS